MRILKVLSLSFTAMLICNNSIISNATADAFDSQQAVPSDVIDAKAQQLEQEIREASNFGQRFLIAEGFSPEDAREIVAAELHEDVAELNSLLDQAGGSPGSSTNGAEIHDLLCGVTALICATDEPCSKSVMKEGQAVTVYGVCKSTGPTRWIRLFCTCVF